MNLLHASATDLRVQCGAENTELETLRLRGVARCNGPDEVPMYKVALPKNKAEVVIVDWFQGMRCTQ